MEPSSFRAVIFDLDGLMLDTESICRIIWQKVARELGRTLSDELYATFIGRKTAECEAMLMELWGDEFPIHLMRDQMALLWARHLAEQEIPRKAGLIELLDFLDTTQVAKAVATSSGHAGARAKLGDLINRFDVLVTGDEVRHGKPAPDIFLLAAERLGVTASNCLVLEDSHAGLQAAGAAGMYTIMVPDLLPPHGDVSHVCKSLHDVQAWLKDRLKPGAPRL